MAAFQPKSLALPVPPSRPKVHLFVIIIFSDFDQGNLTELEEILILLTSIY